MKHLVLALYVHVWARLRNRVLSALGKCRTAVLLYHSVNDDYRNPLTVGVEQFKRHLSLIKRHYDVLDLKTFLAGKDRPRSRPAVVITFDDGYADNYQAAVLMRRENLSATFFLSTGIVGTESPFPHDITWFGRRLPSLSWDQVREMADWGFGFGIHTVSHANLSAIPEDDAREEILSARKRLEQELGTSEPISWLAYPYGGAADITDRVRDSLNSVGIKCCLSAYGGVNPPDFDELNILRCGVDHNASDLALRAVIEGWQRPLRG
ncbi:MAG: polysaccharide deacetylase family protein [Planctomycetota bacterium]